MIRDNSNCYYYFRNDEDNRLDFDFFHPDLDIIINLNEITDYNVVSLGNIIKSIKSGTTPKGMKYIEEGINFLGASNISKYGVDLINVKKIDESYHNNQLSNSQLKSGDILITMAGTIGNSALFENDVPSNINQAVAKLEIDDSLVLGEYLVKYLNSYLGFLFFRKYEHGVGQPNINLEEIKKINVILPPLNIQKNIIDKIKIIEHQANFYKKDLDELYFSIDELFLKVFYNNDDINEFYLFKNNNTFSEVFYNFLENDNYRLDFSFFYHDNILKKLKNNKMILLKDICKSPIKMGEQPKYSEEGVKIFKTVNLKNGCSLDYDNTMFVSKEFYNSKQNAQIKKGNILISSAGYGSIGKVAVYNSDELAMANHKLLIVDLKEEYNPYFISYFLESKLGQIQFDKWVSGSSGQIQLYPRDLDKFLVPNIPLEEQNKFVIQISNEYDKFKEYNIEFEKFWKKSENTFLDLILKDIPF